MTVGSLFSGIGGFDLGLERAGMEIRWQVEIDPFCQAVLAKHWPQVRRYDDVRTVGAHNLERIDLLCGGFPCQPISLVGQRNGHDDPRWLWPQMARLVRELRPRFVLVENVPGLLSIGMGDVLGDLAACGYDAEWDCLSAAAFGADHIRQRVWIVAYPSGLQFRHEPSAWVDDAGYSDPRLVFRQEALLADTNRFAWWFEQQQQGSEGTRPRHESQGRGWWPPEPAVGRVVDGIPDRLDRVAHLGAALVPPIAEWIGRRVMELECR